MTIIQRLLIVTALLLNVSVATGNAEEHRDTKSYEAISDGVQPSLSDVTDELDTLYICHVTSFGLMEMPDRDDLPFILYSKVGYERYFRFLGMNIFPGSLEKPIAKVISGDFSKKDWEAKSLSNDPYKSITVNFNTPVLTVTGLVGIHFTSYSARCELNKDARSEAQLADILYSLTYEWLLKTAEKKDGEDIVTFCKRRLFIPLVPPPFEQCQTVPEILPLFEAKEAIATTAGHICLDAAFGDGDALNYILRNGIYCGDIKKSEHFNKDDFDKSYRRNSIINTCKKSFLALYGTPHWPMEKCRAIPEFIPLLEARGPISNADLCLDAAFGDSDALSFISRNGVYCGEIGKNNK